MKSIVILALLGKISAIELKQLHRAHFWPEDFSRGWVDEDSGILDMNVQAKTDVHLDSDPIHGSLG